MFSQIVNNERRFYKNISYCNTANFDFARRYQPLCIFLKISIL